jgi:hypothetical protein
MNAPDLGARQRGLRAPTDDVPGVAQVEGCPGSIALSFDLLVVVVRGLVLPVTGAIGAEARGIHFGLRERRIHTNGDDSYQGWTARART